MAVPADGASRRAAILRRGHRGEHGDASFPLACLAVGLDPGPP